MFGGFSIRSRFCDVLKPPAPVKEDPRTCKEITSDIWDRITRREVK